MRHAILGAGGVGGLIGAGLARSGQPVTLVVRPESVDTYPRRLSLESRLLGTFEVAVDVAAGLDRSIDVLWVTVKNVDLDAALSLAPGASLGDGVVVPLMN